jgi:hypothetical protein
MNKTNSHTEALLRYLKLNKAINSDYYNKVVKNLNYDRSDHLLKTCIRTSMKYNKR